MLTCVLPTIRTRPICAWSSASSDDGRGKLDRPTTVPAGSHGVQVGALVGQIVAHECRSMCGKQRST
jgi:hypothetical protein